MGFSSGKSGDLTTPQWFARGLKAGIPICLGYFAVAFALGINARNAGMTAFQSGAMSLCMLASAGEYAAIKLIAASAGAAEMIITTVIVNLRYLLMGCALSQKVPGNVPLKHRFLLSYCITDELFAISSSVPGKLNPYYTYGAAIVSVAGWTAGTVLGVIMGNILPQSLVSALSVALYGMFLAVIIPASRKNRFVGLVVLASMLSSLLFKLLPILSCVTEGYRVIILTILISGVAAWLRPVKED